MPVASLLKRERILSFALAESKELSARALAETLLLARTIADVEETEAGIGRSCGRGIWAAFWRGTEMVGEHYDRTSEAHSQSSLFERSYG